MFPEIIFVSAPGVRVAPGGLARLPQDRGDTLPGRRQPQHQE